jgi:hypothetical protein
VEGERSLRWMCTKSFMNSQPILYQEQLLEAVLRRGGAFSSYKNKKYIFSPRRSQVYTFLGSGDILFQTSKVQVNWKIFAIGVTSFFIGCRFVSSIGSFDSLVGEI